jgi:hypothetical protein
MMNCRDQVLLAARRLLDAERRHNPADAIVDVAIGLEALLLQQQQELTFRVKLNYAFLGPSTERSARVTELNDVYDWRNKIVHGRSTKTGGNKLRDVARVGLNALRDALTRFLDDPALRKDATLDEKFWIDRIVSG